MALTKEEERRLFFHDVAITKPVFKDNLPDLSPNQKFLVVGPGDYSEVVALRQLIEEQDGFDDTGDINIHAIDREEKEDRFYNAMLDRLIGPFDVEPQMMNFVTEKDKVRDFLDRYRPTTIIIRRPYLNEEYFDSIVEQFLSYARRNSATMMLTYYVNERPTPKAHQDLLDWGMTYKHVENSIDPHVYIFNPEEKTVS